MNAQHKYDQALAILSAFKQANGFEPPLLTAERGYALGRAGRRSEALAVVEQLTNQTSQKYIDPYLVAVIYASLNDRLEAFALLDKRSMRVPLHDLAALRAEVGFLAVRSPICGTDLSCAP